jgi:hypothetical protein
MTAVANSVFTAAQFNTHLRDNLNETAPAKATTGGRLIVTTGANAIAERVVSQANVDTAQTTTSTSATDLATVGPQVTVTTGTQALVMWSSQLTNNTAGQPSLVDFAVSGASTRSASDATALRYTTSTASYEDRRGTSAYVTGLTAGSNVFTLKYWVGGGTGTFTNRRLIVVAL